ncbi:MAG: sigma-70 family RNA polymerase sigma factor [Oscillospiraceae bacterium]|nr:sigma-70 family RNA polymerase sigma factor [Oscillospiraceae bacterium]
MSDNSQRTCQAPEPGNDEARLLAENTGLIWSIVRRYFGRGVDPDDLYQLGCIGFIKALRGFDTEFGTQFSTYAVPKIAGEIRRFIRDDGPVKVSRSYKEHAYTISKAKTLLEQKLGRAPLLSELSAETGFTAEEIASTEIAVAAPASLSYSSGGDEGDRALEDILANDSGGNDEERLLERLAIRQAIERLPERERKVIALRYYRGLTQDAASKVLNVSQVQVSRIERKATEQLRELLTVNG